MLDSIILCRPPACPRCIPCALFIALFLLWSPATIYGQTANKDQPKASVKMTMADAVIVALTNNVALKSAFLDRILQQFDLRKAEDKFNPQSSMKLTAGRTSTYDAPGSRTDAFNSGGEYTATLTIPTGGSFNFTWNNTGNRPDVGEDMAYTSGWSLTFRQPLLKGGGIENATYSVKVAKITEEQNILSLKDTITSTIKATIAAYRNYMSATRQLEISHQSLDDAKRTFAINEALITAGRKAKTEIVETEANVANRELELMRAKNSLESARLSLVQALNIEKHTQFDLVEENDYRVSPPVLQEAIDIAKINRTDYQRALKNLEIKKWDLSNAKWNRMWTLTLDAGTTDGDASVFYNRYGDAISRATSSGAQRNWNVGLTLEVPFSMLTDDQRSYVSARNELNKAMMNLKKMEVDIEIAVQNAVRDVETNYRQMQLAKQARALSEKKLEVEDEKLKVGRTTNFQLVSYQNDLNNAKVNELNAIMNYLNSLTTLDDTLGTMLATWNINVRKEDEKVRLPDAADKPT
jgi:outer membrane protein TolC